MSKRVKAALFEYLKRLGQDVVMRLLNVVNDNGLDVTAVVARLFQLVNTFIGYEQMHKVNHVRIHRNKLMWQQYHIEAAAAKLASKKPMHQDSPMHWNLTHEMCANAFGKCIVLDNIMDQYATDIGNGALLDLEWHAIDNMSTFLHAPRQVMESLAADHKPTLDLLLMSVSLLLKHCDDNEQ
ncbi:unnamed protein product [Sphagnum jensenii]|uniref:Uncharacterized protein n=1 Tax=Sphagnum jensenii TaxID=128206 RepID=A0ABP1BM46_9BRYO